MSRMRNISLTWILARVFVYVPPFISQILDFIYWTVLTFILIYFEWRDTENQQSARDFKSRNDPAEVASPQKKKQGKIGRR